MKTCTEEAKKRKRIFTFKIPYIVPEFPFLGILLNNGLEVFVLKACMHMHLFSHVQIVNILR